MILNKDHSPALGSYLDLNNFPLKQVLPLQILVRSQQLYFSASNCSTSTAPSMCQTGIHGTILLQGSMIRKIYRGNGGVLPQELHTGFFHDKSVMYGLDPKKIKKII